MNKDVFICHASEDKSDVVWPLVNGLHVNGITYWLDETEILWADSIIQKVNEGLKKSRYVIVILSKSFLGKNWAKRELNGALNIEASSGEPKVLPLLVGNQSERENILREFPLLNDKKYLVWEGLAQPVVEAIRSRLSGTRNDLPESTVKENFQRIDENIPLPKIRKNYTQKDRDDFLKDSFLIIRQYFQSALSKLETQYSEVEIDFTEINSRKFVAKIYYLGNVRSQCKVWVGGLSSTYGISYSETFMNIDNDNSFNEFLTIEDDGIDLKLRPSLGIMYSNTNRKLINPFETAEMLWRRFSAPLEH